MFNYNSTILAHFNNPQYSGELNVKDPDVVTVQAGLPENGAVLQLQVQLDDKHQVIEDAKFKAYGCVATIACGNFIAGLLCQKAVSEVALSTMQIVEALELPAQKQHCAELAHTAVTTILAKVGKL